MPILLILDLNTIALLLAAEDRPQHSMMEFVFGLLPLFLFMGVLFLILRWYLKSGPVKFSLREKERHIEHMKKMEELTERIAKALERNREV